MAYKLAKHLLRRSIVDLVELDDEYSIVEIRTLKDYIIQPGDHFLVVSKTKEVEKWDFLTKE